MLTCLWEREGFGGAQSGAMKLFFTFMSPEKKWSEFKADSRAKKYFSCT